MPQGVYVDAVPLVVAASFVPVVVNEYRAEFLNF